MKKEVKDFMIDFCYILFICFLYSLVYSFVHSFVSKSVNDEKETKEEKVYVYVNLEKDKEETKSTIRYDFMPEEIELFIRDLCNQIEVDSDLVASILNQENPEFDEKAVNVNLNGSEDLGLFQLNSRYLESDFIPSYWSFDIHFDVFNWKHNAFIAINHIKHLLTTFNNPYLVISAYNCGAYAVENGSVPESTMYYRDKVMDKYKKLKEREINVHTYTY